MRRPSLTIGVEEEYLLVDRATRDLVIEPPAGLLTDCEALLGDQVCAEFLKSQIEVETKVCRTVSEARADLVRLRRIVCDVAARYGLAPIASGTHPSARWVHQQHTEKQRYDSLAEDLAGPVRRLVICGLHVHVGIEDDDLRIDLMNQLSYFLPYLLALSTSSPFWEGEDMGVMSYRVSVFDSLPRTGLPEYFDSYAQYQRLVDQLVRADVISDATKIWWDVRPSARFPTLEVRIADVCPRLDDALTIAALYQCLISMLIRLHRKNQRWRIYPLSLIEENRWRAQRNGADGKMIDFGKGQAADFGDLLDELLDLVREDAEELGCVAEIEHAREIVARGTGARRQLNIYREAIAAGTSHEDALRAVVDMLIADMTYGLDGQALES